MLTLALFKNEVVGCPSANIAKMITHEQHINLDYIESNAINFAVVYQQLLQ